MEKNIDIETILSVINYYNITDNYNNILDLYSFIFQKQDLSMIEFFNLYEIGKNHILSLYPNLSNIPFDPYNIVKYVKKQKQLFGNKLTISTYEEKQLILKK